MIHEETHTTHIIPSTAEQRALHLVKIWITCALDVRSDVGLLAWCKWRMNEEGAELSELWVRLLVWMGDVDQTSSS